MKLVGVTPLYPPHSRVGAWLATHSFLAHMAARGHRVDVFRYLTADPFDYLHDGVNVWSSRHAPEDGDVIVGHLGDQGKSVVHARSVGRPLVRMVHGPADDLDGSTLVVFNSESSRDASEWDGPSIVCHPPLHPELHRTDVTGDRVTLVNLSADKGGRLFDLLAASYPNRRFLGVRGGYGKQLMRPRRNVEFMPVQHDMRDVWARTRVLLMPSVKETWGMVGVEAMCSGIPVIAHPTPGLVESLGDAGIFCDRSDLASWRAELARLDDPTEYELASKRALARVDQLDFSQDLARFAGAVEAL